MIDFETVFNESCKRALREKTSKENLFFDRFYERFINSSPLVAEKFRGVDMESQKNMLRQSLSYLLNLFVMRTIPDHLIEIARKHDRHHADIPAHLYASWLECLIDTVREFDPRFDGDVELAWRLICSQGIAFMVFMYDK